MGPSPTQTRTADTELRRGDERLRALMATLEALIDSVDADICLRDREGGLVLWNAAFGRACREVLGVEPKVGLRTVDYLAKDQRDAFDDIRQSFQRVLAGESVQREYVYRWPNGETHRYETTWVPVREGDQVTGVAETTHDVTERAAAEERRREAELKYRSVVEHANEAILVTQDEKVMYFNPRAAEWTGYSQEDFFSRSFTEFVHPADRELVRREHQERQSGKKPSARYQIRTLTKSGEVRHAIVSSVTVAWEGRPASLTLLADVTELAVAEEKIRSAEAKYRIVADFTYDWEYWEAPDGRLEYVSPSCERMTGYPARDFLDRPQLLDDIVHPEDKPTWAAHRCRASSELAPGPCQFRVRTRSDETRWIEHLCRRVTDDEGRYLGIRASNRDITGLRAAEQEARSSREALARVDRVASMGALTGSIAHELNQPLTGILSNAQAAEILLQGGRCDSPGMAEILADVVSDAKRAGQMIRNLRAVFRQQPVELEPLDVNDVVHDSLTLVRRELASHDVKTSTELADTLPKVMGNSAQLQQVLINLIMNAVQAMNDRDDRSLCIGTSTEPRGHVLLWVLDSGPGLEADRLESVFESFSSTRPGNMGMGLRICSSIVEAHCGRIWARNGPDGGAKISIALPANKG